MTFSLDRVDRIGQYEIVRLVGKGGFGLVYEAWDRGLQRTVAIKILDNVGMPEIERFRREAVITDRLGEKASRYVARVYGLFEEASLGVHYLVQEFLSGEDLKEKIDRKDRLPTLLKVLYLRELLAALSCIHNENVIHRDIKPGNIRILTDSSVKLMDFGVSKTQESTDPGLTLEGTFLGTPLFTAPEQLSNSAKATPAADVYSFGVVAFHVLTDGRLPIGSLEGRYTFAEIVTMVLNNTPLHLSRLGLQLPPDLCESVSLCLSKSPSARPSADELLSYVATLYDKGLTSSFDTPAFLRSSAQPVTEDTAGINVSSEAQTSANIDQEGHATPTAKVVSGLKSILKSLLSSLRISGRDSKRKPKKLITAERLLIAAAAVVTVMVPILSINSSKVPEHNTDSNSSDLEAGSEDDEIFPPPPATQRSNGTSTTKPAVPAILLRAEVSEGEIDGVRLLGETSAQGTVHRCRVFREPEWPRIPGWVGGENITVTRELCISGGEVNYVDDLSVERGVAYSYSIELLDSESRIVARGSAEIELPNVNV